MKYIKLFENFDWTEDDFDEEEFNGHLKFVTFGGYSYGNDVYLMDTNEPHDDQIVYLYNNFKHNHMRSLTILTTKQSNDVKNNKGEINVLSMGIDKLYRLGKKWEQYYYNSLPDEIKNKII